MIFAAKNEFFVGYSFIYLFIFAENDLNSQNHNCIAGKQDVLSVLMFDGRESKRDLAERAP